MLNKLYISIITLCKLWKWCSFMYSCFC